MSCALLLAVLLPVQSVALVLDQAWRPAHYHRYLQPGAPMPLAGKALADDTVLAYLDGHSTAAAHVDDSVASDAGADPRDIGHHLHAPGDPDVVYVDDDRQGAGDTVKHASDGVTMLLADGLPLLPRVFVNAPLPDPESTFPSRPALPLERPPQARASGAHPVAAS